MLAGRAFTASLAALGLSHATSDFRGPSNVEPSVDVAKSRAPQIFNAVHDAMRQWGASLHHNGMSFFLATVPKGVILHHGDTSEELPSGLDWLAFEIEHAEIFTGRGFRGPHGGRPGGPGDGSGPPGHGYPGGPPPTLGSTQHGDDQIPQFEGSSLLKHKKIVPEEEALVETVAWLHSYRSTRSLRYLYIDGMSAGKTSKGTLDTQDYLLRGNRAAHGFDDRTENKLRKTRAGGPFDDVARASELCALCKEWNLSGVIRMEAGFEIIQCDFTDGLEEFQALPRPQSPGDGRHRGEIGELFEFPFEYLRGVAERYDGIGASRTIINFSSMVSAYFFPINITNPDLKRPDLPRLLNATDSELDAIRKWLKQTISDRFDDHVQPINWQDVTDLIVGRYADRVKYMATKATSASEISAELKFLLTTFIDYSGKDHDPLPGAIDRCSNFYLHGVRPVSESDHLIHAAIQATTLELCTRLFRVRDIVNGGSDLDEVEKLTQAVDVLLSLMKHLNWARFKRCSACGVDELCLVPMWPTGSKEAYESPHCVNSTTWDEDESYWGDVPNGGGRGQPF